MMLHNIVRTGRASSLRYPPRAPNAANLARRQGAKRSFLFRSKRNDDRPSYSWSPQLLRHTDLDRLLPWGFLDQMQILECVIPRLTKLLAEARGDAVDVDPDAMGMRSGEETNPLESTLADLHRWVTTKKSESRVGGSSFQLAGTSHSEFVSGAALAYQYLANLWSESDATSFTLESAERFATPALAELLCQVHNSNRKTHHVQPKLILHPVEPTLAIVIKVEIEEGRSHKPGQFLGLWDREEMVVSLLEGAAGPEAQLLRQRDSMRQSLLTGSSPHAHIPHRLVAHTLFLSREEYTCHPFAATTPATSCSSSGDEEMRNEQEEQRPSEENETKNNLRTTATAGTFPLKCHVWEFETDVGVSFASGQDVDLQWRVRNINQALKPRAGRVLKSEGLVEKNLWRYVY